MNCTGDDCRRKIAWFKLLIGGAVCSPELVEGSTAIYSIGQTPTNVSYERRRWPKKQPVKSRKKLLRIVGRASVPAGFGLTYQPRNTIGTEADPTLFLCSFIWKTPSA
jgi:hypothetical protein